MTADHATYIMPVRLNNRTPIEELAKYLGSLTTVQVIVVDGSTAALFAELDARLSDGILHVAPDPAIAGLNGKVRGVLTGLRRAMHDKIVVADDDVRYSVSSLAELARLLERCEVVRPQNYFSPMPWHAILDSSRSLINRALDGDWPGTLAFRRSALPHGYCADILFENLELVRTVRARGGRERVARDVFVQRRPPTVQHFWSQRVRQAYDEFARPLHLVTALAILPLIAVGCLKRAWSVPGTLSLAVLTLAMRGWSRDGGWRHFSIVSVFTAPLWMLERAVCAWLALYSRFRFGGVRYGDGIIRAAVASPKQRSRWCL